MRKPKVGIMLGAGLAAAVWIGFGAASAESVEGSIRGGDNRTETSQESSREDHYWRVWNGALPEQPNEGGHHEVLAVLTGKFTGPPIGCTFAFRGGGLEPSTIAARSGTTVRVDNEDAFTHELTVKGLPGFTPLESGPGTVRAISVPAGGPWEIGDRIYGHVDGYLHSMRELVACATVTKGGRFRFDGVPPGPYSLRILRGSEQVAVQRVTVLTGKTLQVDPLTTSESRRK
jgi:hypothetical protein